MKSDQVKAIPCNTETREPFMASLIKKSVNYVAAKLQILLDYIIPREMGQNYVAIGLIVQVIVKHIFFLKFFKLS